MTSLESGIWRCVVSSPFAVRCLLGLVAGAAGILCAAPVYAATIIPFYSDEESDATWTFDGTSYTVPASSEVYDQELWERNVKDQTWSVVDDTMILQSDGLYREYGDLSGAGFGVDEEYLYLYWDVVGDKEIKGDGSSPSTVGLKGHYYFYFQVDGEDPFLLNVDSGTGLSPSYALGGTKLYQDTALNTYGTAIENTCERTNCTPAGLLTMSGFNSEISGDIFARTSSPFRVEVAVPLSLLGLVSGDFADLLWIIAGVATSNPSSGSNLFANDLYPFAQGKGLEYDTLRFSLLDEEQPTPVPEPATLLLLGTGLGVVAVRRRMRAKKQA